MKHRVRNSIRDAKTLPDDDIDSDYNLIVAEVQTMLKAIEKATTKKPKMEFVKNKAKQLM